MSVIKRNGSQGAYFGSSFDSSGTLTAEQQQQNAKYIHSFLNSNGWSLNAVAAILGNMQAESGLNPGRWQSDAVGNTAAGYGLVQWTPATKYFEWCNSEGYSDPSEMDSGLNRIIYEVSAGIQWIQTDTYSFSFEDFTKSNSDAGELAKAFLLNYERPADQGASVQSYRAGLALEWLSFLKSNGSQGGGSGGVGGIRKRKKFNFILFGRRIKN